MAARPGVPGSALRVLEEALGLDLAAAGDTAEAVAAEGAFYLERILTCRRAPRERVCGRGRPGRLEAAPQVRMPAGLEGLEAPPPAGRVAAAVRRGRAAASRWEEPPGHPRATPGRKRPTCASADGPRLAGSAGRRRPRQRRVGLFEDDHCMFNFKATKGGPGELKWDDRKRSDGDE